MEKDFSDLIAGIEDKVYVEAVFTDEDGYQSTEVEVFVPFKHLSLEQPAITHEVTERDDSFTITLHAQKLACFVELDFADSDAIFGDNYFYLSGNTPKKVELMKCDIKGEPIKNAKDLAAKLQVRSLRDTY
jgi:hypothetical protein